MKLKLAIVACFLFLFANAQETEEEIKKKTQPAITSRFPSTRMLDMRFEQYLPTDFDSELFDAPFEKGIIQNHYRFSTSINLPIVIKRKWNITSSIRYRYEAFEVIEYLR